MVHKEEFSIKAIYVRYEHLTKAKPIHMRQTHPLVRENYDHKGSVAKK
jgi:hypothetical protein